jgi:hypothetical protein
MMVRLFAVCLVVAMLLPSPGFADLCGALARCCAQNHGGYAAMNIESTAGAEVPKNHFTAAFAASSTVAGTALVPKQTDTGSTELSIWIKGRRLRTALFLS